VRGVSGVHIDSKGKVLGSLIFVNRLEDIEVESGAATNPNTLAVIVNKSNPVNDLSLAELRRILLGERTNWKGTRKIALLLPSVGTPERQTALRLVAMDESSYKSHWTEMPGADSGAPVAPASGISVNLVAETEDAIAVVPLGDVKGSVKILRIEGNLPGDAGYPIR
jgi:ABC-type phosphate transport system substrate-binding protein